MATKHNSYNPWLDPKKKKKLGQLGKFQYGICILNNINVSIYNLGLMKECGFIEECPFS